MFWLIKLCKQASRRDNYQPIYVSTCTTRVSSGILESAYYKVCYRYKTVISLTRSDFKVD